jgi:hypothetical protein
VASFTHQILQRVQGEPDYHTIHTIQKLLHANARAIDTHLREEDLGHLGIIVSYAAYAIIAPAGEHGRTLWTNPTAPGLASPALDRGTAAQLSAARKSWEEAVLTFRTFNTVQQALKKQIITVFEPMYLDILNEAVVGFANIMAREMLDHLFLTYGNICTRYGTLQPVETLFKQIQDCADFYDAGCVETVHPQQINVGYTNIFATGNFMSACCRWNEKKTEDNTWANFKAHFAAAHRQHKQMQGESAANSGYHASTATVGQTEDQMAQATIGALANLAADRVVVATLTEENSRLARQLEERSNELKEIKSLLKKERANRKGQRVLNPYPDKYCWNHGYKVANSHTIKS